MGNKETKKQKSLKKVIKDINESAKRMREKYLEEKRKGRR